MPGKKEPIRDPAGRMLDDDNGTIYHMDPKNKDRLIKVTRNGNELASYKYHKNIGFLQFRTANRVEEHYPSAVTPRSWKLHGKFIIMVNERESEVYEFGRNCLKSFWIGNKKYTVKTSKTKGFYGSVLEIKESGIIKQRFQYDGFGNFLWRFDENNQPTKERPLSRFLFRSEYYDPETGLYYFGKYQGWYNPIHKERLVGEGFPWKHVYQVSDKISTATEESAVERQKEIKLNKSRHEHRNDDFLDRLGGYFYGVGKAIGVMVGEGVLMIYDWNGNLLGLVVPQYEHNELSSLGIAIADPSLSGGDIVSGMGRGMMALPGDWVNAMESGDMNTVGEKTFDMLAIVEGGQVVLRVAPKIGQSMARVVTPRAPVPLRTPVPPAAVRAVSGTAQRMAKLKRIAAAQKTGTTKVILDQAPKLKEFIKRMVITQSRGQSIRLSFIKKSRVGPQLTPQQIGRIVEAERLVFLGKNTKTFRPSPMDPTSALYRRIFGDSLHWTKSGQSWRGVIPEQVTPTLLLEIKAGYSTLDLTFQLRMHTFMAAKSGKTFVLMTNRSASLLSAELRTFLREFDSIVVDLNGVPINF